MIWWSLSAIWTRYVVVSLFFAPRSSHSRLSIIYTLPVSLSGSVCVSLDAYAAPGRYCRLRIHYRLKIWRSVLGLSPSVVLVMCTKGHSTDQGFALNALGLATITLRNSQGYTFGNIASLPTVPDETRRYSTRRLWCGNAWNTETLSPSSVSPPLRSSLSQNGCPAMNYGDTSRSTPVQTDSVLQVPLLSRLTTL
jgi:hypothetical protein